MFRESSAMRFGSVLPKTASGAVIAICVHSVRILGAFLMHYLCI